MRNGTPTWRKSSYSNTQFECVEVFAEARGVQVRDSKETNRPPLSFDSSAWSGLLGYLADRGTTH